MKAIVWIGAVAMLCAVPLARLAGCETVVRDAAFRGQRDVHQLCVIAPAQNAAAGKITADLKTWLDGTGSSLNIQLVRIDADDSKVNWRDYGIPSAPPVMPVVVLVGRHGDTREAFVVDHWQPAPTPDDLDVLRTSPVREEIQKQVGACLAVLLYAPAQSDASAAPATNSQQAEMLRERIAQSHKSGNPGLVLLSFDRGDPRERILTGFAGLRPDGPDWLGVVFGRGKLLTPPLMGSSIAAGELDGLLAQLTEHCSCTRPLESMGVDIPLAWNNALDARVIAVGNTPDENKALEAQKVLPSVASEIAGDIDVVATAADAVADISTGTDVERSTATVHVIWKASGSFGTGRLFWATLLSLCGLVAAVVIGSVILLRR